MSFQHRKGKGYHIYTTGVIIYTIGEWKGIDGYIPELAFILAHLASCSSLQNLIVRRKCIIKCCCFV